MPIDALELQMGKRPDQRPHWSLRDWEAVALNGDSLMVEFPPAPKLVLTESGVKDLDIMSRF